MELVKLKVRLLLGLSGKPRITGFEKMGSVFGRSLAARVSAVTYCTDRYKIIFRSGAEQGKLTILHPALI